RTKRLVSCAPNASFHARHTPRFMRATRPASCAPSVSLVSEVLTRAGIRRIARQFRPSRNSGRLGKMPPRRNRAANRSKRRRL
ncbi:hypothetical protein, partial [Treponema endosymbiont of Eucomonympha sp.]|uniref:hypothetical protein n=1 Tax=Treponema endosymbiont of Eucomonympha sp. TaxID=1580831 RepID=UPI001E5FD00B